VLTTDTHMLQSAHIARLAVNDISSHKHSRHVLDMLSTYHSVLRDIHFQAALEDSSVWTIIRLTTDLVTCP